MSFSPASNAAIQAIDDLLAGVGLRHGSRRLMAAGFERQKRHPDQLPPEKQRQPRVARSRVEVLRAEPWHGESWLVHGFSTRTGGVTTCYRPGQRTGELNLGFTASDTPANTLANRRRLLTALGTPKMQLVTLTQIHSSLIRTVGSVDAGDGARWKGDGMMTAEPGVLLAIQTADCIPVLVADRKRRVVAAFHAGWRGTLARIVENGIGRMRVQFGSRPHDLTAAIGPGIAQCCYAVGEEVRTEFESQFAYAAELFREVYDSDPIREKYPLLFLTARAPGHSDTGPGLHLDLIEANRRQLLDAGVPAKGIWTAGACTSCQSNRFFSYRAEQGFTGRMLSVIGIAPR